ncbi:preprotein translocase subunit SecE [Candidatus Uhrbacteria bacterium]|nr:preprotein translocase subunit SecE [Candidatus Uhrbacteria bacterium]
MSDATKRLLNNRLTRYLRESKEELEKVTWPNRRESTSYALLVVAVSVGLGVFFFLLDIVFGKGLAQLIRLAS